MLFLLLLSHHVDQVTFGQKALDVIDSVNARVVNNCASFGYEIKVENITDSNTVVLDHGKLIVNNTEGKYDDFLFISMFQKDTFCFVKDTLLVLKKSEINIDYHPKELKVRIGTTKMFFRCFSSSFRNEIKLINPIRWDSISLDSSDQDYYYLSLRDTMILLGILEKKTALIVIEKNKYQIKKYTYSVDSKIGSYTNIFNFSDWAISPKPNDQVYSIFEKLRQTYNSPEYLSKYPTGKMKIDHNKTLPLENLSFIDILDQNYRLSEIKKRYVVLYFWFKGCYYCKFVGPVIEKLYKTNIRNDITYLGLETLAKNKKSLIASIKSNTYDFPNYRYNGGVDGLTVNGAPMVIIYDQLNNKILEQVLGGDENSEAKLFKLIDGLPNE